MRRWVVASAFGALALTGGNVAASDYPPADNPSTTVPAGGSSVIPPSAAAELPATGSGSETTLKIAVGAVAAGAGLLVAARLRRRPSPG